ncbi:MAG: GH1 family beta-glucosidase [Chloroflexota bacterium]|nr:GH1 family beta-glucosidase [Chloroflexota bacterium]
MAAADVRFPEGFVWGAATSSYQIEGAVAEDGRGPSIWDTFAHTPGTVATGDTGDVASDHYHRYRDDVGLMRELGLTGYRFSVAWPRIFPEGRGRPNSAGLDFYKRLVDELRQAGIEPFLTLYHWDLPQALQDAGGWEHRDTVGRFAEYAHTMAVALDTEVGHWITVNEPWVSSIVGNLYGIHAPGKHDLKTALQVAHHQLLAHGEAVGALRAELPATAKIGIALSLTHTEPFGDSQADADAAEREDGFMNRWFLDPLCRGRYPADMWEWYGEAVPEMRATDLATISVPTDFLGINYYFRDVVEYDRSERPVAARSIVPAGQPVTAVGWEVYPPGLYETLARVHQDYAPAMIYITENGAAFEDRLIDGQVDDPERESYIHRHLHEVHRAIAAGVPVGGYFVWSLLDNFEWSAGYAIRFGIVHVDYATQARTIKRSGHWYAEAARENGISS